MSAIFFIRSCSTFLRSLLETMLRLAASLTTLAGNESKRVMRPWSLKELRYNAVISWESFIASCQFMLAQVRLQPLLAITALENQL